jgi:hypothetical protein
VTSLVLTIIGPTIISLWLLVMGVLMWRPGGPPAVDAAGRQARGAQATT